MPKAKKKPVKARETSLRTKIAGLGEMVKDSRRTKKTKGGKKNARV